MRAVCQVLQRVPSPLPVAERVDVSEDQGLLQEHALISMCIFQTFLTAKHALREPWVTWRSLPGLVVSGVGLGCVPTRACRRYLGLHRRWRYEQNRENWRQTHFC